MQSVLTQLDRVVEACRPHIFEAKNLVQLEVWWQRTISYIWVRGRYGVNNRPMSATEIRMDVRH